MRSHVIVSICLVLVCGSSVADEIRSELAGGYYVCSIDDETLAKTPQWSNLASDPPLSLSNAIRIATARMEVLRKNDTAINWTLSSVALKRVQPGTWYYVSTFRSKLKPDPPSDQGRITRYDPYKAPRELHIPVLMNGSIPEMVEHRHSVQLLKLLDDLEL